MLHHSSRRSPQPRSALAVGLVLVWGSMFSPAAAAADGQPMFLAPRFAAGDGAAATAIADFDADGRLDVAVSCELEDSIALLLGRADGRFEAPVLVPVGDGPLGLVAADFNADGASDLAVADRGADDIRVLLGAGDGSFAAPIVLPVDDGPRPLAVGDLNGDRIPDLVVGNQYAYTTTVLLGLGNGDFIPATTIASGREASDIAIADLDVDGVADVVVTNWLDRDFAVLRGLGGGTLAPPVNSSMDDFPSGVVVADFDGDGLPDVAVACMNFTNSLLIRRGAGGGTFGPVVVVSGSPPSHDLLATDIDDDGDPDVLLAGDLGFLYALRNNGALAFNQAAFTPIGRSEQGLSLADLDGDGLDDFVAASPLDDDIVVLRGEGQGSFEKSPMESTGGSLPKGALLVDVDNDALLDLVVAHQFEDVVTVRRGLGGGSFGPPIESPTSIDPRTPSAGDVDGDGIVDLAIVVSSFVKIRKGTGDGHFGGLQTIGGVDNAGSIRLLDEDGDTDLDLFVVLPYSDAIRVFRNDGRGYFTAFIGKQVGDQPAGFDAADLDGDGNLDFVVAVSIANSIAVLMGTGGGGLADVVALPTVTFPNSVSAFDLDADGAIDLIVSAFGLYVHWGRGNGTFDPTPMLLDGGQSPTRVLFEDMDGDGQRDLIASDGTKQFISILKGLGAGDFKAPKRFVTYRYSGLVAAADLDGDQAKDLVAVGNVTNGVLTVMLNRNEVPWHDLGNALAGSAGVPHLAGQGSLEPATPFSITLTGAKPFSSSTLVAGLSAIDAPFKGGVMVPALDVVIFGLPTGSSGGFALSSTWPEVLPSGFQIYLQSWIVDPTGPVGLTASNALLATTR